MKTHAFSFASVGFVVVVLAASAWAAPVIPNPSFETNTFASPPGFINQVGNGTISGWTTNAPNLAGLNPAGGQNLFADNGKVPQGTRVAFLHSNNPTPTTLSTTITGLIAGRHYRVKFFYNAGAGPANPGSPVMSVRINGDFPRLDDTISPVDALGVHEDNYNDFFAIFRAAGPTATLEISNQTTAASTLLIDHFSIVEATPVQVTNANNDGPGSFRELVEQADDAGNATGAFRVITFAPALSGQTITLHSRVLIDIEKAVVIDASALPKGLTIAGFPGTSALNLLRLDDTVHLLGLTITGGRGSDGAVLVAESAHAQITRCTLVGNGGATATGGGAIRVASGAAALNHCTLSGNSSAAAGGVGGAIAVTSGERLFLDQCTIAGNTATSSGGGIHNDGGAVTLRNSIVSGNTAPSGTNLQNQTAASSLNFEGANLASFSNPNAGSVTGSPNTANAGLATLQDNGGPTRTIGLQTTSPARNASVPLLPLHTTDQRGFPVQGTAHDIGAFDVQRGAIRLNGRETVPEDGGTESVSLERVGGFEGGITVLFSAIPGTAGAADFEPFNNRVISFPDGITLGSTDVTIKDDALVESNEVFTVRLTAPPGTTLGTPAAATVTIVDPSSTSNITDEVAPLAPTIGSPVAGAIFNQAIQPMSFTLTGTATDNKGVDAVQLRFNFDQGALITGFMDATSLGSTDAAFTTWTMNHGGVTGFFKVLTVEARTRDLAGRLSPIVSRSFKIHHPLRVAIVGEGTVTPAAYAPTSFREVGTAQVVTATPSPGFLFAGWTVLNATNAEIGVPEVALERPTLIFLHRPNLELIANFVPSQFVAGITGAYKGLLEANGSEPFPTGTASSISTEGLFNATVSTNGLLSGTIQIDGASLGFAGVMDHLGVARFGSSRARTLRLVRSGKPTMVLECFMDTVGVTLIPSMTVILRTVDARNVVVSESRSFATRAAFSTANPVPGFLLGGNPNATSVTYNVILRPVDFTQQPPGFEKSFYPQGAGFGRMTLNRAGSVTLTGCTLADGTTGVTTSTFLDQNFKAVFFVPLYNKQGFLRNRLEIGTGIDPNATVAGTAGKWLRPPISTSHYYRGGWPEVININTQGALYFVTAGQSSLRRANFAPIGPADLNGNAQLQFTEGQLTEGLVKRLNVGTNDAVTKITGNDPTFTLTITRATGLFSGTFQHTDSNLIPFKGILYQQGTLSAGWGFFLTKQPVPIDFSGEGGMVNLVADP